MHNLKTGNILFPGHLRAPILQNAEHLRMADIRFGVVRGLSLLCLGRLNVRIRG